MNQGIDGTGTEACAKTTLRSVTRTGVLLMGAVLASVLAVDLPVPAAEVQPYVAASDTWIALGAEEGSDRPAPGLAPRIEQGSPGRLGAPGS